MTTGVNCIVLVDGVRAPDGTPGDDITGPVVLENLTVTWGRDDTMSQPEADSCSFDILDTLTDSGRARAFVGMFRTGSRIDVVARGVVGGELSAPTFTNPGFEGAGITWAGAPASVTATRASTGSKALRIASSDPVAPTVVILAPAPFEAAGTNPDAWDAIPTTELGQTWDTTISLWVPVGATADVRPTLFAGPYADAWETPAGAGTHVVGNGAWQSFTIHYYVLESVARWVGFEVTFNPARPTWDQMPPALTWDASDPALLWDDVDAMFIDDAQVISPGTPSARSVLVFAGRVTGLVSKWDDSAGAPVVSVTANGFTADLQNRVIGSEPWNVEPAADRANRILTLAGLPITIDIDDTLQDVLLSWRDVDSQGALTLLNAIAVSVDGVLWPAVHAAIGAYLRLEDPALRAALLRLAQFDGPPAVVLATNLATNPDAENFGAVITVRNNWVYNPVPASITGYSRAGVVASTVTFETTGGPAASGGKWIKNTITNAAAGTDNQINVGGQVVGQYRHASAWVWSSKALSVRIAGWTYGAANEYLGSANDITTPNIAIPANAWTFIQGAFSIPPTAYQRVQPFLRVVSSTPVIAPDVYGCAMLTFSDGQGGTFNGATPASGDFTYAWSGAVNGSPSLQRAPNVAGVANYNGALAARWSSIIAPDTGLRSFAFLPLVATPVGFIWNIAPTVIKAGQWITVIARVKAAAGTTVALTIRTSSGGAVAGVVSASNTGSWETLTTTAQSVTDGDFIGAQMLNRSPYPLGVIHYIDRMIIVVGSAPYTGTYFDGNTPDTETENYAWSGTVHASTSTKSTVQTHTVHIVETDPDEGVNLSACEILRDPVSWEQSVSDLATRVGVAWKLQGVDDEGKTTATDVTETVIDASLETLYGTRGVSVTTDLISAPDANTLGQKILTRTSSDAWRANGLTVDDDDMPQGEEGSAKMLTLLDGTSRIGAPLILGELPSWAPAGADSGVYLEGGTYSYAGGRWVLELAVSSSNGQGGSAAWDELDPDWLWKEFDPSITWNALRGVTA